MSEVAGKAKPRLAGIQRDAAARSLSRPAGRAEVSDERLPGVHSNTSLEHASRALSARGALELQRLIGNHCTVQVIQRDIKFARFSGRFSNWGLYNRTESQILKVLAETRDLLAGLNSHRADLLFGPKLAQLNKRLGDLDGKTYAESEYDGVLETLKGLFKDATALRVNVSKRDDDRSVELNKLLGGALQEVEHESQKSKPHQLTRNEIGEIKSLLLDVWSGQKSNLAIEVYMPFPTVDLAQRAAQRELTAPEELVPLEREISELEESALCIRDERKKELIERKYAIRLEKPKAHDADERVAAIDRELKEIADERALVQNQADERKAEYKLLVEELVRREVMKDLVTIAQTGVGRDLLREIAKSSFERNARKVTIRAYDQFRAADAGEDKEKKTPYVNYTPQYFRDRDTRQREEGGALVKAEELAKSNPWQENKRSDVTLFHELVHTHHYQSGTAKTDNKLVSNEDAVAEIDRPYTTSQGQTKGVREEEYFTVGLGQYRKLKFTENSYREERARVGNEKLGDNSIKLREYYTHLDKEGKPIALES